MDILKNVVNEGTQVEGFAKYFICKEEYNHISKKDATLLIKSVSTLIRQPIKLLKARDIVQEIENTSSAELLFRNLTSEEIFAIGNIFSFCDLGFVVIDEEQKIIFTTTNALGSLGHVISK